MKKFILFFLLFAITSFGLNGQLFCPDDITVSCLSDLTPDECGMATVVSGNYHPSMVKYVDQNETNACNEGKVFRRFYLDTDYSNSYDDTEPSCIQTITLEYNSFPLNISFPSEKEYTCVDEVPVESPVWLHHPCDLVGYTYEDEVFEFEEGACLKIVRTFSVINWCIYEDNPLEGLVTGIQIIKIIDELAPEIENCEDRYFDAGANCETMVTLTNSATDLGDCPSGTLTWRVSVDLWGDGTDDLFYGPNELAPFSLDPAGNGESIEINIPEALAVSKNKIVWKVTDGCGNVRTCSNEFFVEDNKPPTPYCLNFTSSALNADHGGQLIIPASLFNVDAVDNCSPKESIIFSFSENIDDTEKVIECGDQGFQFFRIYYTDEAGNQDFCEVFMLVFDNGTCFGRYAPSGVVSKPNGLAIQGASAYLMEDDNVVSLIDSDEFGFFSFGEQDLMETYNASLKKEDADSGLVDLEDFILMRSALVGLESLDFYQKVAADINQDKVFDLDDLYAFKDVLLGSEEIAAEDLWTFVPKMHDVYANPTDLDVSQNIPYSLYEEGFNFYGIQTGDITGSKIELEEATTTVDEIELILEIDEDNISILADQDFESDAYQFDIVGDIVELLDESENKAYLQRGENARLMNINSSELISKGNLLFTAISDFSEVTSIDEIITSALIYQNNAAIPSKIKWTVIDNRSQNATILNESTPINVFPLPMNDRLTIEAEYIEAVTLFNISGEKISIDISINKFDAELITKNELPRGIYFLKVITAKEDSIIKIVK